MLSTAFLFAGLSLVGQDKADYLQNPDYGPDEDARTKCAMNLSIMSEYVKIKSYELAVDSWRECFVNCPKSSKNIYIYGAKIAEHKIESSEDEAIRQAWVDTLMLVYEKRMEYFNQAGFVYGKMGMDLLQYRREAAFEQVYEYLGKSIELRGPEVSEAVAATYYSVCNALYQKGTVSGDDMINNYIKVIDVLELKLADNSDDPAVKDAITRVEKDFAESGAAGCESLVNIFTPKFEAEPENIELLKKITALLSEAGCLDSDLFASASEAQYAVEPSAKAAANLATVFISRGDMKKATEYYEKAIEQETDVNDKADYYFQLGLIALKESNYQLARKHARSAISVKPDFGNAYIMIGDAYASSAESCGSTPFEKGTVYLVAVDKYLKAKSVDPSVAETASAKIKVYESYFPNSDDAFFQGYTKGDAYTVGCWINESTSIRTTN